MAERVPKRADDQSLQTNGHTKILEMAAPTEGRH